MLWPSTSWLAFAYKMYIWNVTALMSVLYCVLNLILRVQTPHSHCTISWLTHQIHHIPDNKFTKPSIRMNMYDPFSPDCGCVRIVAKLLTNASKAKSIAFWCGLWLYLFFCLVLMDRVQTQFFKIRFSEMPCTVENIVCVTLRKWTEDLNLDIGILFAIKNEWSVNPLRNWLMTDSVHSKIG